MGSTRISPQTALSSVATLNINKPAKIHHIVSGRNGSKNKIIPIHKSWRIGLIKGSENRAAGAYGRPHVYGILCLADGQDFNHWK